jgi:hypothetical protein
MPDEGSTARLPGLAKFILCISFILAVCIWFFVTDDHGAMLPYNPQPHPKEATSQGATRHQRQGVTGLGERVTANKAYSPPKRRHSRPTRTDDAFDRIKSREVRQAAADPNSMFDMSTP